MNDDERRALAALRSDWALTREDVWGPLEAHVESLNGHVVDAVLAGYADASRHTTGSPLGVAITGDPGVGKTHLLARVRSQVQDAGGYFFLVSLRQGQDFWQNVVHALMSGLRRPTPSGDDQLTVMLRRLSDRLEITDDLRGQIIGDRPVTPGGLLDFAKALRRADRVIGRECAYTARALVLANAEDDDAQNVSEEYLTGLGENEPGEWGRWGIRPFPKSAQQVTWEMSRLLALTGPSVLAVDQIDQLIAQSERTTDQLDTESGQLMEQLGSGLMDLREWTSRTLTVVSCFQASWDGITGYAVRSARDRFRAASPLEERVPSAAIGRELIAERFRRRFERVGFAPPYPTWPVEPEAFADAPLLTPRQLIARIDAHIADCLARGTVEPVKRLDSEPVAMTEPKPVAHDRLTRLDARFAALRDEADPAVALNPSFEDAEMVTLLPALLHAWIIEHPDEGYTIDQAEPGRRPAVHARLRQTLDENGVHQIHRSFRAIAAAHANAVRPRLERFRGNAGLNDSVSNSHGYVLRRDGWPGGEKTREAIEAYTAAGGVVLAPEPDDLATCAALRAMLSEGDADLAAWLLSRRPASRTRLLIEVFGEPGEPRGDGGNGSPPGGPRTNPSSGPRPSGPATSGPDLSIGRATDAGTAVRAPLESLRKHAVIFAGSGSGKTVLIRRLVEECALRGVSSIVLDPNNDLARLGDPWPSPPETWGDGDAEKARAYLDGTDVIIWTPRREAGRPLSFQPLPDFAAVADDPDEFGLALDTAVAALAPRAKTDGSTAKAERGRAVLREALAYFARQGGTGLSGFLDLLAELPDGVTSLAKAQAIAADLAQTLTAAMINDPLFGGSGVPLDPGVLLTPPEGKRARVSVISFVGLPSNEQRQSFVNQLQMALFAWIKRHPAGERPLGGLFVMDEAQTLAPSGALTACTESTLALASQARKYGLGLIFATQAPRGIHNRIVGNAATQFYGFLNSPVQIAAAKEMASAKSSGVVDISRLTAGQFYAVGEGLPFQKVAMPMCLSHHPASALTAEEVLARAREGA